MTDKRKAYLTVMAVGAVIAVAAFLLGGESEYPVIHRLCDACFVPGVFLMGIGIIQACANQGIFYAMGYGLQVTANMFLPFLGLHKTADGREESFLDYRERKDAKRKSPRAMILAGATYLAVSLVLLAVYYLFPATT